MTDASWTRKDNSPVVEKKNHQWKFILGGLVIGAIIIYLVINAMSGSTQLYKTVNEFYEDKDRLVGRDLRVAGWVIGDTIVYTQVDSQNSVLEFDIVDNIESPSDRLHIVAYNEPMPDLLQHEAQALVEGRADSNGEFTANPGGLFLKCPTRYEEMEMPTEHSELAG